MQRWLREWRDALRHRWHQQSVRRQLMISISTISMAAILLSIMLAVLDARGRVEVEVNSSMELAQQLVHDMVKRLSTDEELKELFKAAPAQLKYVRHTRILATNSHGQLVQIAPDEEAKRKVEGRREQVPYWFRALVGPGVTTREVRVVPDAGTVGRIKIVSEPGDELGEVWEEVSRRAVIWFGITGMMLVFLYLVLGRLLNPLVGLARGMHELEDGHYGTRVPEPPVRELAAIAARFNMLAEALEKARAENSRLYGDLVALQEDERREIANELHDEAGPCLFGITANVSSIERIAKKVPEEQAKQIKMRADEILTIAQRLKTINRDLLRRLRPVELGHIPLEELIGSLVAGFQRRHPEVNFALSISSIAQSYGEAIDLTCFRCVQETLTNAMQHGGASRVSIDLREQPATNIGGNWAGGKLHLTVRDDGVGFSPGVPMGIGMTAMRERVRGIEGSSEIASSPEEGTTISVVVPLRAGRVRTIKRSAIEGAA